MVRERRTHRGRDLRRRRPLELETETLPSPDDQKIQLSPSMRGPEMTLLGLGPEMLGDEAEGKALPGRTDFGVSREFALGLEAQQAVKETRIGDVDLRRLHLALAKVRRPWLQNADDESRSENVEIAAHGMVRYAERARELGAVPDLTVVVREHRPETPQGRRGNGEPELRQISFEKGADEVVSPLSARAERSCREGPRKASPEPQPFESDRARLVQR